MSLKNQKTKVKIKLDKQEKQITFLKVHTFGNSWTKLKQESKRFPFLQNMDKTLQLSSWTAKENLCQVTSSVHMIWLKLKMKKLLKVNISQFQLKESFTFLKEKEKEDKRKKILQLNSLL
jgi:hypothetical protein